MHHGFRRKTGFALSATLAFGLMLTACSGDDDAVSDKAQMDPGLEGALGDQIMVDPDLAGQNEGNAALTAGNRSGALPELVRSPEASAAAREEAARMVGGADAMKSAPSPQDMAGAGDPANVLTAAARAAAAPGTDANCADKAQYTMKWAARLPRAFPVYPRGAVQEAAGTDEGACALRVVNFLTPVPRGEVVDFYYTRAVANGFAVQNTADGSDIVLGGKKGAASFVLYARELPGGGTEADLITSGG
jgi:hypothetical protein